MKQIKTIKNRLDNAEHFDEEVNAAIAEGWQLTKREVLQPNTQPTNGQLMHTMLYAELEREVEEEQEQEDGCWNCAHSGKAAYLEPCCDCSDDGDKWEPAEQ